MKRIGIDIGASSCQLVVTDGEENVLYECSKLHHSKVQSTLLSFFQELTDQKLLKEKEKIQIGTCGSMCGLTGLDETYHSNEVLAIIHGATKLYPEGKSIICLGAQNTYYIELQEEKEPKIYKNNNCSAGTGSFFEEQAGRIGVQLEEISDLISTATSVPHIAGRCSVFSKTDIIHKMQEGVGTADLLNGLCYALVRNFKSNVLRGREIQKPVIFAGGVMKNTGVVKALKELLSLTEEEVICSPSSDCYCALGAALESEKEITVSDLIASIQSVKPKAETSIYRPLYEYKSEDDVFSFDADGMKSGKTYLGIDIGSTSINLVLIGEDDRMQYYTYIKNTGNPLKLVRAEMEKMKAEMPEGCSIEGIAVTGSGREYIARELGASITINEITAQTEGALLSHPETDTVFEIGGQDSKYMSVRNGHMDNFEMNKICAAGTGAFLEEQIKKLGIGLSEFSELALQSENPCELGSRCTVFIESGITKAIADERSMPDICAGIALSIVENYLHRVVNQKPVGHHIALQGGIAYNQAVVCAFRQLTGKEVVISDHFSVTGALGAAHLCRTGNFLHFNKEKNRSMNKFVVDETEASYMKKYHPEPGSGKKVVGIPRALFLHIAFPLFCSMFKNLGFDVLISPLTDKHIVELSQEYTKEEVCYPIKLLNGHVAWLLEQGVDYVLMPRVYTVLINKDGARRNYGCMYFQTSSLILEETFHFKEKGVTLLQPELSLEFGMKYNLKNILQIGPDVGKSKPELMAAMALAIKDMGAHLARLGQLGNIALSDDEPTFVLITRPYNLYDPVLNMGIQEQLDKLGCRVIHLEHLDARKLVTLPEEYRDMCWPFGQHIMSGINCTMGKKNLYPIYITNHGCGPDSTIQHCVKQEMEGREYLHLEVDEHSSPIGIITRIEAFLYTLRGQNNEEAVHTVKTPHAGLQHVAIIPELGVYTDFLKDAVLTQFGSPLDVKIAGPMQHHKPINYAINNEYYTLQVLLEEMLGAVEKGKMNDLYFPMNEGAETFNMYAHLIADELKRRGYFVDLHAFYLEDLIDFKNSDQLYQDLIRQDLISAIPEEEREALLSQVKLKPGSKEYLQELATLVNAAHKNQRNRKLFVIGESLCIYKKYIAEENFQAFGDENLFIPMPFSEAFLMNALDINANSSRKQKRDYRGWVKLHEAVANCMPDSDLFTPMEQLMAAADEKIPFMAGGYARYRFAKTLCLHKKNTDGMITLNSSDENTAIILRLLMESKENTVEVPSIRGSVDFEHHITEEEAEPFLHAVDAVRQKGV